MTLAIAAPVLSKLPGSTRAIEIWHKYFGHEMDLKWLAEYAAVWWTLTETACQVISTFYFSYHMKPKPLARSAKRPYSSYPVSNEQY